MPLNNFDPTTDTSNFNSGSTRRLLTLYNRASSRYVRIHGRRVDAKGSQDDPHGKCAASFHYHVLFAMTTSLNADEETRWLSGRAVVS